MALHGKTPTPTQSLLVCTSTQNTLATSQKPTPHPYTLFCLKTIALLLLFVYDLCQMASACVNNMGLSTEAFLDCPPYGWLSPRISFGRELPDEDHCFPKVNKGNGCNKHSTQPQQSATPQQKEPICLVDCTQMTDPDLELSTGDFEFRLEDPVTMLPADELILDGKLVPLQPSWAQAPVNDLTIRGTRSPETANKVRTNEVSCTDRYLFSPKAPRCSSRWKELLGLKKLYQNKSEAQKTSVLSSSSSRNTNSKAMKLFLHRSSKSLSGSSSSSSDASLSLPLLKDSDWESVSISSSRLSLSSSSSGHDHEDLPRLSLDSDKPNPKPNPILLHRNPSTVHPRIKMVKPRLSSDNYPRSTMDNPAALRNGRSTMRRAGGESSGMASRGLSVDSPRMSSSGKIVFQSLERSSSSPGSIHGGPKLKPRGMERSYSANVRVTPVLNVPVCSLRGSSKSVSVFGFGQLFSSQQKRENGGQHGHANGGVGGGSNRPQHVNSIRHRKDRT